MGFRDYGYISPGEYAVSQTIVAVISFGISLSFVLWAGYAFKKYAENGATYLPK